MPATLHSVIYIVPMGRFILEFSWLVYLCARLAVVGAMLAVTSSPFVCVCILHLGHICSHSVFSITFLSDLGIHGILNSFCKYYQYNFKQDHL
jgi:hypothetical protein